jgi:hypothetical protein
MDVATAALLLHLITPCRYLDTREPACIVGSGRVCHSGPFADAERRAYLVQAVAECPAPARPIPIGAQGLLVTVTATGATAPGWLLLYDATILSRPLASTLVFEAGHSSTTSAIVQLGQEQGQVPGQQIMPDLAIYARVPGGTVHVVVDIVGYLEAAP